MTDPDASSSPAEQADESTRWSIPWAVVMTAALLALFEFQVARQDWFWAYVPRSQVGVIDALETQVLPESDPLVLFMGSSRVRDAISPRTLERKLSLPQGSVLNLGLTMGTPFDAEILYRRNRSKLGQAKLVFFGVEPFQLDRHNAPTDRVLRYGTLRDRLAFFGRNDGAFRVAGFFWRTLDTGPTMQRFLKSTFKAERDAPAIAPDGRVQWRTDAENEKARKRKVSAEAERFLRDWEFSRNRQERLHELLELFAEDGMTVVVFQVPARDKFWAYAQKTYPEKIKEYSARVREASAGHDVYMYWDASEHRLQARNFYDYGHLKPRPARSFTRRIGTLIRAKFPDVLEQLREESLLRSDDELDELDELD